MPTPVITARQCLTTEAAQAIDEAVAVARRRGHGQTTSLHALSALLSPPSALREACGRCRNSTYSSRIQIKALELCLGVSLDRLPSSPQRVEEPPISNSLMAAIKRSQANQRRQPENFQLYQQLQQQHHHHIHQQSSSSSIPMVKVELQTLILSILDDPIVSRVFGESGFRSFDIKLAILRPVHQLLRYSRYRGPPMFLCNLTGDSDLNRQGFSFPFSGVSEVSNGDENCRRIGEVLVRNRERNPLLIGVSANDALRNFSEIVERNCRGVLPMEITGLDIISIGNDITKFVTENSDERVVKLRFEEVGRIVEHCIGPGVIISYGDLRTLVGEEASVATVSHVVGELAKLVNTYGKKVWLIGATASDETYLKFSNIFPSIEKSWDLQLLPITSLKPSSMGESYSKSRLMESFVPFGGFFSTTPDPKSPLTSSYQCVSRCHLCNEKCEQEVAAVLKGGFTLSVADQYQSMLPSWLQMAELSTPCGFDVLKAKDDGLVLNAKIAGLQRKWDNVCQHHHHTQLFPKANTYQGGSPVPASVGLRVIDDNKENADIHSSFSGNASPNASGGKTVNSCMSMDLQKVSSSDTSVPLPGVSKATDDKFPSKPSEEPPNTKDTSSSSTSATSVTTDLGLGISSVSPIRELDKPTNQPRMENDLVTASISNYTAQSSSGSCPDLNGPYDQTDFKTLYWALNEKISRQEEAVSVICQTIVHRRTKNQKCFGSSLRGDIWFNFAGPDKFGKRRTAIALAEVLYGSSESIICADLSSQSGIILAENGCSSQEINGYDAKFRGKTIIDYIAGELSRNPLSIVFLENIDRSDVLSQNSLSRAARTGRFSDSHGKEVSINNAVFVTTSRFTKADRSLSLTTETSNYSEERIQRVKGWPIKILVGSIRDESSLLNNPDNRKSNPVFANKRKSSVINEKEHENSELVKRAHRTSNLLLDLNVPAEEIELHETDESSNEWLEDFTEQLDQTVVFRPFNFDGLAEKLSKKISACFHKIVGSNCILEMESKVMEQLVAASCVLDSNRVEDWVQQVLCRGFLEAHKRYNLTTCCVVKLVTSECPSSEEQEPGIYLPARIIMN